MKLKKILAAAVLTTAVTLTPAVAGASEIEISDLNKQETPLRMLGLIPDPKPEKKKEEPKPEPPKVPIEYIVVERDNLTKVAKAHQTTVQRLWSKNVALTDPNMLKIGDKLVIPFPDEVIADRPMPVVPAVVINAQVGVVSRAVIPGNTYYWGNCTWYAKNRRMDLPNSLGNADTWYSRAKSQGIPTGLEPRVGAIAQTKGRMHVAYVEEVYGNGTIKVSEMNVRGLGQISTRVAPASNYFYIY